MMMEGRIMLSCKPEWEHREDRGDPVGGARAQGSQEAGLIDGDIWRPVNP